MKLTTPTVKQPAQFMKMMETGFNFHPVQFIGKGENRFKSDLYEFFCTVGSEAIAAGSFLPITIPVWSTARSPHPLWSSGFDHRAACSLSH